MEILFSILRFIGVLFLVLMVFNLMIVVHEWGHFLAGRWRGLVIDRFQIWFGKPIWKKTYNGVQYGLGSIPAGGFVSLPQMAPMESIEGSTSDDVKKEPLPPVSPLDKIIVAFAGPLFSFLLALAFACAVWVAKKPVDEITATTTIGYVAKDSPAAAVGIKPGDVVKRINGNTVKQFIGMNDSVKWFIISSPTDDLTIDVERDGKELSFQVNVPLPEPEKVEGNAIKQFFAGAFKRPQLRSLGIAPGVSPVVAGFLNESPHSPAEAAGLQVGDIVKAIDGKPIRLLDEAFDYPYEAGKPVEFTVERNGKAVTLTFTPRLPDEPADHKKVETGIVYNYGGKKEMVRLNPITQVIDGSRTIFNTLKAVTNPDTGIGPSQLSGPIGILGVYYDLFQHKDGWRLVLWFSVILNINLAILNLLPFPVLDGGHIVMSTFEAIRRRPMNLKVLEVVQTAFVVLLLGFMAFVSLKDVGDRVPKASAAPETEPAAPVFLPPKG
jgi:regulator of sigma E protease